MAAARHLLPHAVHASFRNSPAQRGTSGSSRMSAQAPSTKSSRSRRLNAAPWVCNSTSRRRRNDSLSRKNMGAVLVEGRRQRSRRAGQGGRVVGQSLLQRVAKIKNLPNLSPHDFYYIGY